MESPGSFFLGLLAFLALSAVTVEGMQSCTEQGMFSCYTCMGRDNENCDWGEACCAGSCWKLIDEEHSIIAKGCRADRQQAGSSHTWKTDVRLPFTRNEDTPQGEFLQGTAYYCGEKGQNLEDSNFCNSATAVLPFALPLLLSLIVALARL